MRVWVTLCGRVGELTAAIALAIHRGENSQRIEHR